MFIVTEYAALTKMIGNRELRIFRSACSLIIVNIWIKHHKYILVFFKLQSKHN